MASLFQELSDSARVWIWISERPMTATQQDRVRRALGEFLETWTTHGRQIRGAAAVLREQVVVLAGEVDEGEISGCGIDRSVHLLEHVGQELGFSWSSPLDVPFIQEHDGPIELLPRTHFAELARNGGLRSDVAIIDRTLEVLAELRDSGLHRPARDTWAARYFSSAGTPAS